MRPSFTSKGIISTLILIGLVTVLAVIPAFFETSAGKSVDDGAKVRGDYDLRRDKNRIQRLVEYRQAASKNAAEIADIRDLFVRGEERLRIEVPTLKVEYNEDIRIPEVIGPDVKQGAAFLTQPSAADRSELLLDFLKGNSELVGVTTEQIGQLKVVADYKNPESDLAFVELNQEINGVPVFRGEVKAGFTKDDAIFRVINNLAPGLDPSSISREFGDPSAAVRAAAKNIDHELIEKAVRHNPKESTENKAVFGSGDWAITAEKMYFPTEPGVAVPAWRVLIWERTDAFYVIVDAENETMLWRKSITNDQTQPATYNVYANPNAMVNVADSPFPFTPGPTSPNGTQGTAISRTLVTRIGNEAPYTFNDLGWITDGNNTTDGNNVEAGLDRELPNPGIGAGIDPNGIAVGSPNRMFDFPINPGIPTNPAANGGDPPLPAGQAPTTCQAQGTATAPTSYQKAVVTQLFYISNWYHDETYRLGFTEQSGNFQNDNFGRGGAGNDRVSAEAQDCSGTNNAGFSTPADGGRGRMQMFLWTAPTPDYDGSLDADIVIHELTHGLSNRLHGDSAGLSGLNMSRAMGEGWSDFYAHAMLSEPTDPINGIYPTGGYAKYGSVAGFNNYYYGVRRFPKAVMAFTGPNGRPHNPLTFNDIDTTKINLTDGAFAPAFGATADGVHPGGEIWSSALWEIRAKYINRLGWEVGNRRTLQHITDGMKLAPLAPTFLSERDAIIAGVLASGTAEDVRDTWAGFAIRGLGYSATIQNSGGFDAFGSGTGLTRVTEAFDLPNLQQLPVLFATDSLQGDNDGIVEPGETVQLRISLINLTGKLVKNVSVGIDGIGSMRWWPLAHGVSAARDYTYTVPSDTPCGSILNFQIRINSSLGPTTVQRSIIVGQTTTTFSENFDAVVPPAFPAGWTVASSYGPMTFVTTASDSDTAPNSAFAADLPNCTGTGCPAGDGGGTELTSPTIAISVPTATVSFRHRFNTEFGFDGGVLEISIGGGTFQDIITAGGQFVSNGYNATLGVSNPNPLGGRGAWSGDSNGYLTTVVRVPASASGQTVNLRWRFGTDNDTAPSGGGWNVDSITVAGSASCSFFSSIRTK